MILRSSGINVLSLCFHVNSLLSPSDFDHGMSLDTFMYSRMRMINGGIVVLPITGKVLSHCGILMFYYVTKMNLKAIQYSFFG